MDKITIKDRLSASMSVDNSADDARTHDIMAKIKCTKSGVDSVFDGVVSVDGQALATFSSYGSELAISFMATEERPSILAAVTQFINNVKTQDYDI